MNVYVLKEGNSLLIIDSGLTAHRGAILSQLATLIDEQTELTFLPFRYGELNPLCNFGAIADRFGVSRVVGDYFGPPYEWLDFLPGSLGMDVLQGAAVEAFPTTGRIAVAPGGERALETFVPPIWLIPHAWGYDAASRTLFATDVFTWVYRPTSRGPWVVDAATDDTTLDVVADALTQNMYWWLPGANTEGMRRDLAAVFERYDIETIAPGYGCILTGKQVVERHVELLDEVLRQAANQQPQGIAVGAWRHDGRAGS